MTLPEKTGLGSGPHQLSLLCVEFEAIGGHQLANLRDTQLQLSGSRLEVVAMTVHVSVCRRQMRLKYTVLIYNVRRVHNEQQRT